MKSLCCNLNKNMHCVREAKTIISVSVNKSFFFLCTGDFYPGFQDCIFKVQGRKLYLNTREWTKGNLYYNKDCILSQCHPLKPNPGLIQYHLTTYLQFVEKAKNHGDTCQKNEHKHCKGNYPGSVSRKHQASPLVEFRRSECGL